MQLTLSDVVRFCDGVYTGTEDIWDKMHALPLRGVSIDSRTVRPGDLFIPLVGTRHDGHDFALEALSKGARASLWQKDHGNPPAHQPFVIVENTLRSLKSLAMMVRNVSDVRVVAVTGSNGKTTTRTFIASVLSRRYRTHQSIGNFNNEIGLPLSILNMPDDTEVLVLEMGMNHEGEIASLSKLARPDQAIITNVGEAHIGYLGSREAIARAKSEIVLGMGSGGTLYIPYGERCGEALVRKSPYIQSFSGRILSCGLLHPADHGEMGGDAGTGPDRAPKDGPDVWGRLLEDKGLFGSTWEVGFRAESGRADTLTLKLLGSFYGHNALYAYAVGRYFGLSGDEIAQGLLEVLPPKGRMTVYTSPRGALFIDDSYNANPSSLRAALDSLIRLDGYDKKVLALGDFGELGAHEAALYAELARGPWWSSLHVLLYGERVAKLYELLKGLTRPKTLAWYDREEDFVSALERYDRPRVALLFKASRAAGFDRLVASLLGGSS